MRNFRARTDAKAWTLRERHDPAQPSSSAYLAVYGWVRGTVARGFAAPHMSAFGTKRTYRDDLLFVRFRGQTRKHLVPLSLTGSDGHSAAFTRLPYRP